MIKLKTCNLCKKMFKPAARGRLEIVKKLEKGDVEIWVCPRCTPQVAERLKDLDILY